MLNQQVSLLTQQLKDAKSEIEKVTEHIICSPDGEAYFEARKSFEKNRFQYKGPEASKPGPDGGLSDLGAAVRNTPRPPGAI